MDWQDTQRNKEEKTICRARSCGRKKQESPNIRPYRNLKIIQDSEGC